MEGCMYHSTRLREPLLVPDQESIPPLFGFRCRSIRNHNHRWSALADVLRERQAVGLKRLERIAWLPVDACGKPAWFPRGCDKVLPQRREPDPWPRYELEGRHKVLHRLVYEERLGLSIQESAGVRDIRLSSENYSRVCSQVCCLLRFAFGCHVDAKGVWPFAEIL